MNKELEKRWKEGQKPFDGNVLALEDFMVLPELLKFLKMLSMVLEKHFSDSKLFILDDWHEHDGYLTTANQCSWKMIEEILSSEENLYNSRSGDTFVRKAILAENMDFLFRYYIMDKDEDSEYPGIWGDCDICAPALVLTEIKAKLNSEINLLLYEGPAKAYFDSAYAG